MHGGPGIEQLYNWSVQNCICNDGLWLSPMKTMFTNDEKEIKLHYITFQLYQEMIRSSSVPGWYPNCEHNGNWTHVLVRSTLTDELMICAVNYPDDKSVSFSSLCTFSYHNILHWQTDLKHLFSVSSNNILASAWKGWPVKGVDGVQKLQYSSL